MILGYSGKYKCGRTFQTHRFSLEEIFYRNIFNFWQIITIFYCNSRNPSMSELKPSHRAFVIIAKMFYNFCRRILSLQKNKPFIQSQFCLRISSVSFLSLKVGLLLSVFFFLKFSEIIIASSDLIVFYITNSPLRFIQTQVQ